MNRTCSGSSLVCHASLAGDSQTCIQCGTDVGVECCPGQTCPGANLYCSSGFCQSCGTRSGLSCCPGSTCASGYQCNTSSGVCEGLAGAYCHDMISDLPCASPLVCVNSACTAP
jgi:hypothetical protein